MTGKILEFEDVMRWINQEHKQRISNLTWFKKRVERATSQAL